MPRHRWSNREKGLAFLDVTALGILGIVILKLMQVGVFAESSAPSPTLNPTATDTPHPIPTEIFTPEPSSTETPTPTLTPTLTLTPNPTATPEQFLGGIPDCWPLSFDQISAAGDQDQRDAWNSLSPDILGRPEDTVALRCWLEQMQNLFDDGETLQPGQITTIEKIAELHDLDLGAMSTLDMPVIHWSDYTLASENLLDHSGLGILTTADNFSETIVHLADQLATAGRTKVGSGVSVVDSRQIALNIAADFSLEGLWGFGIDHSLVDEINRMCLTVRPVTGATRIDQPEGVVFASWQDDIQPGHETVKNDEFQLSNKDGFLVTARLVNADQLNSIQHRLTESGHHVTTAKVADGYYVALQVYDLRNEQPNTQLVLHDPKADNIGSGDQLIPCGAPESSPISTPTARPTPQPTSQLTPEITPTLTRTPTPTSTPHLTETPRFTPTITVSPSETLPVPSATPTPPALTETPRFTDTPSPIVTEHFTATVQNSTDVPTMTPAPTEAGTPTQPPTPTERPTWTPIPTHPATLTPNPEPSPTVWPTPPQPWIKLMAKLGLSK